MARIQIIDDDYWCGEAIIAFLMDVAAGARFESKCVPEADDGRDIYIVDNEFEDGDHGVDLVRSIRRRNPEALIVLCTATRERVDPTTAMNAGCNALIEKGSASGRNALASIVKRYTDVRAEVASRPSIRAALADIKAIIATWNQRMGQEDEIDPSVRLAG